MLYDSSENLDDAFFKTLTKVEIADIVMFVGSRVGMWDGFTHTKGRYTKKKKPTALAINASLLAEAFGIGSRKMADMSDILFNLLRSTREDFIRVDTCVPRMIWFFASLRGIEFLKPDNSRG